MSVLWTSEALARAMGARVSGAPSHEIKGVSIDSRTIEPGAAFFAIKGDRVDGHDYVTKALARGAGVAVIAAERLAAMPTGAPLLIVEDVLEALRAAARAARARSGAKVIAVTGSAGKTGTKDALKLVLAREGETHASVASFNNHWGVPLSLARLPESARFAVFELGMNHAGEIEPLVKLVRPHVAIITTIEAVHLEYFSGIEAIADAKAEIFLGLEPDGAAVLPRDNPQFARLAEAARKAKVARIVSFGEHPEAGARSIDAGLKADCSTVQARILGDDVTYKVGAAGRHLVMNSLAVLAAAKLVGADLALSALALADLVPPTGRGRRLTLDVGDGDALLIDESYNANPASMRAALDVLAQAPIGKRGRRVAVLGDMLELGPDAAELHRGLAEAVTNAKVDTVYCAGPLMHELWDALPAALRGGYAESADLLEPEVVASVRAGDAIMVKGSNGSRMGPIVRALAERFRAPSAAGTAV
ncbi:MAG TPA: UDP-N-acetylmuramoylalanyl-D-glutamyl-2,6-diaminopimelate--D-alanyl-D-alanine ligase [Xanthobacteraceae bacterium]|nr:UDP-N-acetylmuramoylalanyl-D-glutamyl-2,6-diaminopimelate--D-alanyl-D-alanine ligase [Xanthobacteraceae bacterium]